MAYTTKQISKMSPADVETAWENVDMYADRAGYRRLCVARDANFEKRIKDIKRFEALLEILYKDLEDGTYGIRRGSEDDHCEMILIAERQNLHVPADWR